MRQLKLLVLGVGLFAALWVCVACVAGNRASARGAAGDAHWVHDAELRLRMAELDRAARSDWPQEMEGNAPIRDPAPDPCLAEAVKHAAALAQAARRIPENAARAKLPEVDRRAFLAQAETLFDQATRLEDATRNADAAAMRLALADIDATCVSCHTRFRDVSGALRR